MKPRDEAKKSLEAKKSESKPVVPDVEAWSTLSPSISETYSSVS